FGVALAVATVACSVGETTYETVTLPVRARNETRTCESPFAKPDLATLEACGDGKGHCFDGKKTPIPEKNLEQCSGSNVCVPDKLLSANGGKLKACTFFMGNKPGACMSLVVKDIAANKEMLKQDVCEPDERCAPCINPLDGTDTHLCEEIGVHETDCIGGEAARPESCCHGFGVCMNEDAAPEDQRGNLSRETCPNKKLCAPAAMVEGAPVKCEVLGVDGVCLDTCFAGMLKPTTPVMRGGCGPTEVCLPCVVGKSQGMPGC
ncbi:MAG: Tryptophan synthase alpha chain, partial [Labilithrix sp.]|nr:Tryptophan synthase alpha chain [Labilithrix sp.]